jgi:hypothetical protein
MQQETERSKPREECTTCNSSDTQWVRRGMSDRGLRKEQLGDEKRKEQLINE